MGFEFKKKFGQNFLSDDEILAQIVKKSGVMCDDVVVEIGAGKGALTKFLSKNAKKVVSFEIDSQLFDFLENEFAGSNVEFVFKDIMTITDEKLNSLVGGNFKLVANLPYYITSPIITRFLKNDKLESLTVMVQEEVADRIVAEPKTKDYGVLTILCKLFGNAEKVLKVPREKFYPVPKVDSAVIKIEKTSGEILDKKLYEEFVTFIKRAFSMRRKKLSTNLSSEKLSKEELEKIFAKLNLKPDVRAEELSLDEFKLLFELIFGKKL